MATIANHIYNSTKDLAEMVKQCNEKYVAIRYDRPDKMYGINGVSQGMCFLTKVLY